MNTITTPGSTHQNDWRIPLTAAARRLAIRLANYHDKPVHDDSRAETVLMLEGFEEFFRRALPRADDQIIMGLVELCALESGRARLLAQADGEVHHG